MIFIHHGRGVEGGLGELLEEYDLVHPPITDLKVEGVRELVGLYSQSYPQRNPCLVAGPLDEADPSTLDILLKRIEEPIKNAPTLILWARDLGGVPSTIRSRCGEKFHYAPHSVHPNKAQGDALFRSIIEDDLLGVITLLRGVENGQERGVLEAYVENLIEGGREDLYGEGLKGLLDQVRISKSSLFGYFLGLGVER
jgi:hypothetical protein